jgi:hypothetical protein
MKKKVVEQNQPRYWNHLNGRGTCYSRIWDGGNGSQGSHFVWQEKFVFYFCIFSILGFLLCFSCFANLMIFLKIHFDFFMWFVACVILTKSINTCMIKQCNGLLIVSCDPLTCRAMKRHLVES